MLNKENLLCVSSNTPEPGYVPAKLTIARRSLLFSSSYGYVRNSYGELNPNVINGISIDTIRVTGNTVYATVPFYWNDKKIFRRSKSSRPSKSMVKFSWSNSRYLAEWGVIRSLAKHLKESFKIFEGFLVC